MEKDEERVVRWVGDSLASLRGFPAETRWVMGRALAKAQSGLRHREASPMRGPLRGVLGIRHNHEGDTYRVYYTLKCPGSVYVLHAMKKKSKSGIGLPKHEADLILKRFRECWADCEDGRERWG